MNFIKLTGVELKKIRRSKIFWILLVPVVVLWIPAVLNADMNFQMQSEGISPENNFLIQSFMGFAWFMYPASMIICTVMMTQIERMHKGCLKMLSLPVNTGALSLAKFAVLLILAAIQMVMMTAGYFISAWIASEIQDYSFMLEPMAVFRKIGLIYVSSIPMAAVYWLLAICIQTPIFSIGSGLASIVPSVLIINTKLWYLYPVCYPFRLMMTGMLDMADHLGKAKNDLFPWIPAAVIITLVCLIISGLRFGRAERT